MFRTVICTYRSLQPVPVLWHIRPISIWRKIEILWGLQRVGNSKLSKMSNSQILSPSQPSVCIPRTFSSITWQQVKEVFEEILGPGCVERVDMVRKTGRGDDRFQRVFIHFKQWPSTQKAQQVRRKLLDGNEIKIVYDEPWFWKCSASRVPKPDGGRGRSPNARHPYIADGSPTQQRRRTSGRRSCSGSRDGRATSQNGRAAGGDTV